MASQRWALPGKRVVTLHLNSWLARALKPGSINNCATLSPGHIFVSRDWITPKGFAHEYGHTEQAEARGWGYVPWILWCLLTHGYANSPAEVDADAYMMAHFAEFPTIGTIPEGYA